MTSIEPYSTELKAVQIIKKQYCYFLYSRLRLFLILVSQCHTSTCKIYVTYIYIYIYEICNALIVEDGSNQRRGLLLGGIILHDTFSYIQSLHSVQCEMTLVNNCSEDVSVKLRLLNSRVSKHSVVLKNISMFSLHKNHSSYVRNTKWHKLFTVNTDVLLKTIPQVTGLQLLGYYCKCYCM